MCVVATQPSVFTAAAVKRRKRRVPAVHDASEAEMHPMSSDDYAASSADISSSSSHEDINASCEQHVFEKEVPSDNGSASVFWISSLVAASDGFVTTMDSVDSLTYSCPLSLSVQKLHLGQCNSDSAVLIQDCHTLADEIDLTGGDDTLVEAGRVEDLQAGRQVDVSMGGEGSQEAQEQSAQSEGLSSVSQSDRHAVDGFIEHVSNEDGDDNGKVSEQPGVENLMAAQVESAYYDGIVLYAKGQEYMKEDVMLIGDQKLQEAELSSKSSLQRESCRTDDDDDDDDVSKPRSPRFASLTAGGRTASLSLSQLNVQSCCDIYNVEDISFPESYQAGEIDCGSFRRRTVSLPSLMLVSAEANPHMLESALWELQNNHCGEINPLRKDSINDVVGEVGDDDMRASVKQLQQPADVDGISHLVECVSTDFNKTGNETEHVAEDLLHKSEMFADKSYVTAHGEESLTACINVYEMPSSKLPSASTDVQTSLAETGQDMQQLAVSAFVGEADMHRTPGSFAVEVTSDTAATAPVVHADDSKMPESGTNEANHTFAVRSTDSINHPADDLQQMWKIHDRARLHDTYVREPDDWRDTDTGLSEDMMMPVYTGNAVKVAGTDGQTFHINCDTGYHVEASVANGNVKSQLQFGSENIAYQSVTEEKDVREVSAISETPSAALKVSSNVSYSHVSDVESSDAYVNDKENKDVQHLLALETAVMERAVVEEQSGTSDSDSDHVHSFGDGKSESSRLNTPLLPDELQVTVDTKTSTEAVLEAVLDQSEADKGEVDNAEAIKPVDVPRSTGGGHFLEQSGSTVLELSDLSLQVSAVKRLHLTDEHEYEQHLLENGESYNMSSTSEAAEENHQCNSSNVLPFEDSVHYENSHSCILPLGMTEEGTLVNVRGKGCCSYLARSMNVEYGVDSDPCTHLKGNVHEHADNDNVNVASSYSAQVNEPRVDINKDSGVSAEPLQEFWHNKLQVFPADGLPVLVSHKPNGSPVSSDHLSGMPSGSNDHSTTESLNDRHLTMLALEPVTSGCGSETLTVSSESHALYNGSWDAADLVSVNAELGNLASGVNVETLNETVAGEQTSAAVIATCDSSTVIGCAGSDAALDKPVVFLLEKSNDDVHRAVTEIGRDISNSGGLNTSGLNSAVSVNNSSLPDEAVVSVLDRHSSFRLNSVCHDQSKVAVVKPEENREEIIPDTSMKAVVEGCAAFENVQVLTNESAYDGSMMSVISETNNDCQSPEADDSVQSEISSWNMSTAVVSDSHNVTEPLNTLADSVLKTEIGDKNNEQHGFFSKQEAADSAAVPKTDAVREVNVALQNEWEVVEIGDDSGQKETVQHADCLVQYYVCHSSVVNRSELSDNKEAVSAELMLDDAVRNRTVLSASIDVADSLVDISHMKDCSNFSTQPEQRLNITEARQPCKTAESLVNSMSNKPAVYEEYDQLLDHGVVAVQKDSDSIDDEQTSSEPSESVALVNIIVASQRGDTQHLPAADAELSVSGSAAVTQIDAANLHAHSLAEQVNVGQNDAALSVISESSVHTAAIDHHEDYMKPDTDSERQEVAAQCQDGWLCGGPTIDETLRFSKLHAIAADADSKMRTVLFSNDDEEIISSAVTENFDRERLMVVDLDTNAVRMANRQTPDMLESHHRTLWSVEIQEDHLMHDDAPFVNTIDKAVLSESVSVKEDFCEMDADMMTVAEAADDGNIVPVGITGDTNMSAMPDTTVVPIKSSTDSGLKTHTVGEVLNLIDNVQSECTSKNSLIIAKTMPVDSNDGSSSRSIVPSVTKSDETSRSESVSVADSQKVVELEVRRTTVSGSVSHCDAVEPIMSVSDCSAHSSVAAAVVNSDGEDADFTSATVSETLETTLLLSNATTATVLHNAAASVNFPELQGKINNTKSVMTGLIISSDVSHQTAKSLAAAGTVKETEEYTSTLGQNVVSNSDVSLAETAALLGLPDSDVSGVIVNASITHSSGADTRTSSLDFRLEKLEEDANVVSTWSQNSAADGSGDDEHKQLREVIPVEYGAQNYIQSGVRMCENEATGSAAAIGNVSNGHAAESILFLDDDSVIDEIRNSDVSEQEPAKDNAVVAKQTEFCE